MWDCEDEVVLPRTSDSAGIPRVVPSISSAFEDSIWYRRARLGLGLSGSYARRWAACKTRPREAQAVVAI